MVYAPDLCQILWPWHAGHSRLFCPLALGVPPQGYTLGRDLGSLAVWVSRSPSVFGCNSIFWRGKPQVTYVTLVPWGNETLRLEALLLASLPALASFLDICLCHSACWGDKDSTESNWSGWHPRARPQRLSCRAGWGIYRYIEPFAVEVHCSNLPEEVHSSNIFQWL